MLKLSKMALLGVIIVSVLVGAFLGYITEKNKLDKMMAVSAAGYQQQINDLNGQVISLKNQINSLSPKAATKAK